VTVVRPLQQTVTDSVEYTGTTSAVEMVEIRARVEGFLQSIEFEEGKAVKKGDLLFVIDPQPFQAALDQANAAAELAAASLQSAKAELERASAEVKNAEAQLSRVEQAIAAAPGAVTREELDLRRTAVLTAKAVEDAARAAIASANAQIEASKAEVTAAKLNLSYTQVRSPIDGRAGRRMVDLGSLVGAGEKTLLTSVVRYDPIYAFFAVSETDLLEFNREALKKAPSGTTSEQIKLNKTIFLGLGDEKGFPHKGKADYADLAVDQSTGTYLVRGVFPNPDLLIPPGAFVRVQCPRKQIEATLVNQRAVGRDQSGAYLLLVDKDNVVERCPVELGGKYDGMQAVSGSIGPDDRVIVNGLQRARPGSKVAPQEAEPTAEPAAESPTQSAEEG
jgi:RND family efflux transporter MFP subunit